MASAGEVKQEPEHEGPEHHLRGSDCIRGQQIFCREMTGLDFSLRKTSRDGVKTELGKNQIGG